MHSIYDDIFSVISQICSYYIKFFTNKNYMYIKKYLIVMLIFYALAIKNEFVSKWYNFVLESKYVIVH